MSARAIWNRARDVAVLHESEGGNMLKKVALPLVALLLVAGCAPINGWFGWSQTPIAAPAPPPAPPPTVSFLMFFDWDSDKLTPEGQRAAHEAAEAFRARSATRATINGHTDRTG